MSFLWLPLVHTPLSLSSASRPSPSSLSHPPLFMPPPPQVGEQTRPLTMVSIEEFLRDFGLEPEFATHSNIRGLSGGQKVKLVLAAAMWSNPHMLIMDEPTNYLDRESLGALALAIKEWNGEAKGGGGL